VISGSLIIVCLQVLALSRFQFLSDFDETWHRLLEPKTKESFVGGENEISRSPIFTPVCQKVAPWKCIFNGNNN